MRRTRLTPTAEHRTVDPLLADLAGNAEPALAVWMRRNRARLAALLTAQDEAYVESVDTLDYRLPGGKHLWERGRFTVQLVEHGRPETKPVLVEAEGWRLLDPRRVPIPHLLVRLPFGLPVVVRRHGYAGLWGLTTHGMLGYGDPSLSPEPTVALDLARHAVREAHGKAALEVAEPQPSVYAGGGGFTMPALDAAHTALLQLLRLAPRNPLAGAGIDFGPVAMRHFMRRAELPAELTNAVVHRDIPGMARPPSFVRPSQIKAIREALVSEGVVVPEQTDTYGRVRSWAFAPVEKFATREAYENALTALRARILDAVEV